MLCSGIVTIICPYLGDIEDPTMVKRSHVHVYWCTKAVNKGKQQEKHILYVSGDLMITASFYCTAPLTCNSNCMSTSPWYGSHMQMKPSKWRALSRIICIWLRTGYLHYILFTNTCKQNHKSNLITEQILHPHFVHFASITDKLVSLLSLGHKDVLTSDLTCIFISLPLLDDQSWILWSG